MSQWSVFGVDITPKFTDDIKNVLKVTSKKEIFFDVFECMYNGKTIIVEKVGTSDGLPVVSFEAVKNNKKYKCEALLVESEESELFLNENHLQFLKSIQKTPIKTIIEEKVEKVIPTNTVYEDKVRDVSEKIIKESQEKAQKLYDNKLKEYKKHKQLIAKQAEEYLNEKTESIRQELYEQYIDFLSSNDKKVNNLVKSNIDDITLSIDENNKEILSKVDKLSNLNKEELAKILSENIININNNLDSKVKDLNDQLDIILHDSNTKLNKLDEKTSRLLEKNIKHTDEIVKNITSKIEQVDEKIEDYKIDTFKHVVEKVADNKTEIEASLKNTISKINEQVDIKRDEVEKILAAELSNINEKLNIFSEEEDKKYKQLLENLNNLNKGEVKEILSEKINDKQLNSLKLDISKQFQNEMMSIKRLIEMSSGGGSVAKQFANGGTMDGSLNVTGDISASGSITATEIISAGVNINTLFGSGGGVGTLQQVTDLGNFTTNSINAASLSAQGVSTFNSTVNFFPPLGRAITARSTNSNNPGIQANFEGPVTVGHDLFQRSGFENGFSDNSNHFHSVTEINRIEQQAEGDVKNIGSVQERYYAIPSNVLPGNQAAFWAWHQVARSIATSTVNTDSATLDVSLLQNSSNRLSASQAFFASNTTPAGTSENLVISLTGHGIADGANVTMNFSQSFPGPIVAANLFGKVTDTTTDALSVVLYDGNYKSTDEVPLGTSQTALNFKEDGQSLVTLQTIGTSTVVLAGQENELSFYNKTNFSPERLKNEFITASFNTTGHNLVKNEHVTLITSGITTTGDNIPVKEDGYILNPDVDGDGLKVLIVLGRRIKQYNLGTFTTLVGSANWTLHKGTTDGIHQDTLGDQHFNFNANNIGEVSSYQIGPGSQTDSPSAISIGKNVYNRDDNTIKIGYDNEMLDITPTGLKTPGNITATGSISAAKLDVSGDANIDGTLTADKISLSDNSFIVETGDFTLSDSHKGATILLQNTGGITITVPALSTGHTTSFIAETANTVAFQAGAGLSGLNSFNEANSMLGQFAQAQIIFKTPEYAFLGGQIT
jgi:signal peptidase I/F0F1-type ATP synthase membrane subunit b/b'